MTFRAIALSVVLVAIPLAGCSSQAPSPSAPATVTVTAAAPPVSGTTSAPVVSAPSVTTPVEPANPVPILGKIVGCVIGPDVVAGSHDIDGNRYADCKLSLPAGQHAAVTVRTYPSDPRVVEARTIRSDDTTKTVTGPTFVVKVTPDTASHITEAGMAAIAAQVGGTVVPAG